MKAIKTLPHATRGWWRGTNGGVGEDRVLYVTDVDLNLELPQINLELEDINIMLEVEIEEIELNDDD